MKKVKNRKILSPRDIKFRYELGINRPQKQCLKINFPVLQDDFGKRTANHYIDHDCIRRARRAKAKKARGGLTLAQCAVKCMKKAQKPVTAVQLQKHMKSTKISMFVLGHVLKQLKSKGVVKAHKGTFRLTGKRIPKAKTAHLFKKNKKVAKKVAKKTRKSKKVKRSVKARK